MRAILFLSVVLTGIAPKSCQEKEGLLEGRPIQINAPQFVAPNANFTVVVQYEGGTNGCAKPHSLVFQGDDTLKVIRAYYVQQAMKGQVCATVMPVHELSLEDEAPGAGYVRYTDAEGNELGRVNVRKPLDE